MGANSHIPWTDHTFNGWIGCAKVSPGCQFCYAAELDRRRFSKTLGGGTKGSPVLHFGHGAPRHRTSEATWRQPLKWNAEAGEQLAAFNREVQGSFGHLCEIMEEPRRPRVFCASLADWLDDEVPVAWLADLLDLIRRTPNLDWLLLTKRPQNWRARVFRAWWAHEYYHADTCQLVKEWLCGEPPANVWIGTTVEDQQRADERIPELLKIPARVRFLSCEPLLEGVNLHSLAIKVDSWRVGESFDGPQPLDGIGWVIAGAESGPKRRPMSPDWARSLRNQCKAAGVPFFMKQMEVAGKVTDELASFPADLQVREFPEVSA